MGRTAQDFERYAKSDFRAYIKNFELPDPEIREPSMDGTLVLPAVDARFTKNHQNSKLDVQHEVWRCLETIHDSGPQLTRLVRPWIDATFFPVSSFLLNLEYIPEDPRYNLPARMPPLYIESYTDITNVYTWVTLAAITAMRVFHCHNAQFKNMSLFSSQIVDQSAGPARLLFDYIVWKRDPKAPKPEPQPAGEKKKQTEVESNPVVLAYLSPHSLTAREMEELVDCGAFPVYNHMNPHDLQGKYRLWAKIWDACQVEKTRWFIITNYTHWVFGGFSGAGRAAFVSQIIPYKTKDKKTNTVLEWMTFWMASACKMTDFTLPKIFEPVTTSHDFYKSQVQGREPVAPSVSVWSEPEPDEAIDIDMDLQLARETSPFPVNKEQTEAWIGACREYFPLQLPVDEDDFQFGPEPVRLFEMNKPRGEWMI